MGDRRVDQKELNDSLAECQETVEQLKEENAQLRESSETFGDLAERLNRRNARIDRRRDPTRIGDRRRPPERGVTGGGASS